MKKSGIYQIDIEAYHKSPELRFAYSSSDLDAVRLSPSNLIQKRARSLDTDALRTGRADHLRLEYFDNPDEYLKRIIPEPKINKQSNAGKEAWAKWLQDKALLDKEGKIILSQDEFDDVELRLSNLMAHPDAFQLLKAKGIAEETFIWQDKDSGVWCKCRPDKRILQGPSKIFENLIIDWKTVRAFDSIVDLGWESLKRNYHTKAAFISDGVKSVLGKEPGPFVNVFVEKGGLGRVVCAVIDEQDIENGRRQYKADLAAIAQAEKSNVWAGFVDLKLPMRAA